MTEERARELAKVEQYLDEQKGIGIDLAAHGRLSLIVAGDYGREQQWPAVLRVVEKVSPDYLKGSDFAEHCGGADFLAMVYDLACWLVEAGQVDLAKRYHFTSPPAKA